jgi:hypothetical protein
MTTCRSDELLKCHFKKIGFYFEKIEKNLLSNFKVLLAKLLKLI